MSHVGFADIKEHFRPTLNLSVCCTYFGSIRPSPSFSFLRPSVVFQAFLSTICSTPFNYIPFTYHISIRVYMCINIYHCKCNKQKNAIVLIHKRFISKCTRPIFRLYIFVYNAHFLFVLTQNFSETDILKTMCL